MKTFLFFARIALCLIVIIATIRASFAWSAPASAACFVAAAVVALFTLISVRLDE